MIRQTPPRGLHKPPKPPMSHLLLAGAGDLARHTAPLLAKQGFQITGLRRRPPATDSAIQWRSADLTRPETLSHSAPDASHVLYAASPDGRDPDAYRRIFLDGPANLLNALSPDTLQRFVFVSSTAVYGPSAEWVDDTTAAQPESFNGEILLQAEQKLRDRLGDKLVVIRPSGLYGPGRTMLLQRLQRGDIKVAAAPTHWANRFHIADAARACAHLLQLPHAKPCYIGSDGHPLPLTVLYDALADMLGVARPQRGGAPLPMASKRLRPQALLESGFQAEWPDALKGYRAIIGG